MKDITVILPIYKLNVDEVIMLNNALESVHPFKEQVKVTLVFPDVLKTEVNSFLSEAKKLKEIEIKLLQNSTGETDFVSQLNLGIDDCDTEWFSILEIDDEYKPVWLKSMNAYKNEFKDVDIFLPIIRDVNVEGKFLSYMNESVWAWGFSDTQGYLDLDLLTEYQNFQTSGGLYRTQVIKEYGSFKNNIQLTFSYEFLMRMAHRLGLKKIMTVPKIGYQHVNLREGSLFWLYKNDEKWMLSEDEVKFWLKTAKEEYFFINKRDVKFETA